MGPVVEHLLLLRMEYAYGEEPLLLNVLKTRETVDLFVLADMAEVPFDASQLVSYLLADFLGGFNAALGQVEESAVCGFPVSPGLSLFAVLRPVQSSVTVNDDLRSPMCLVA